MHHRHTRLLGPRLHVNNLSIYSSILLLVLVAVLHQQQQQVAEAVFGRPTNAPKDYAPVVAQRRVKDLIEFFEVLDKSSNDVKLAQRTSVVLSLSESASKLYTLAHGMALEAKCNMYVKLISLPNIRNVATISALMKEGPSLDELVQSDANVIARLTSERNFEALARIQTIIQTLESERTLGKSDLEPSVEKELLECVNYYVYRHQQAVSSVVNYVHDSLASLSNSLNEQTNSKILVERFREPIERIVSIEQQQKHQVNNEQEAQFNYKDWLEALGQLRALVMENEFEVPQLVRDFLADPQRAQRLELWLKSDQLAKELIEAESSSSWFNKQSGVAQRKVVRQLFNLCKEPTDGSAQIRPPQETCKLLDDSKRSKTVKELIIEWEARKKLANSNRSTRPIAAAPAAPAATTTTTARTPEPVGSGLNASNAPTSEPTTNTLRHVKSEPDLNRQGLSAFLAGKTMITTPPRDEPTSRPSLGPRKKSFNFLNWVYGKDKQREDD